MLHRSFAALLVVLSSFALLPRQGSAQALEFFGEDLSGFSQSNLRLFDFPDATGAFDLFRGALTADVGIESFEGFTTGTTNPTLNFPGAGTATLSGGGSVRRTPNLSSSNSGVYGSSGLAYFEVNTAGAGFTIDFSDPTAGFGFFASDIGDYGGQLVLRFLDASGTTTEVDVPHTVTASTQTGGTNSGSMLFYGRIDTTNPFTSVTFTDRGTSEGFAFDDMVMAAPDQVVVPEPGTLLLLASGLFGMAGVGLGRRRNTHEQAG